MATRLVPIIGVAFTDTDLSDCVDEAVYHVAVAPHARLDIQRRIANAVYRLPRPILQNAFYGAALMAEDDHIGLGQPWPYGHTELFLTVVERMWNVVAKTQLSIA